MFPVIFLRSESLEVGCRKSEVIIGNIGGRIKEGFIAIKVSYFDDAKVWRLFWLSTEAGVAVNDFRFQSVDFRFSCTLALLWVELSYLIVFQIFFCKVTAGILVKY